MELDDLLVSSNWRSRNQQRSSTLEILHGQCNEGLEIRPLRVG